MKAKQQIYGLSPYQPGKPIEEVKRELGLERVIKLASNENPFGPSPKAQEAIRETATETHIYPDGYAADIRSAVASHLDVSEEQLIFGAGSDEVILMLCRAFLSQETNTVMATPSFSQYKHNAVIEGAEIREVPLKEGVHDLNEMLDQIDEKTKIVWVCNPNNPSGTYVNENAFRAFMKKVPEDVLVVSDEAYVEYVTAEDYPKTLPMLEEYPNLMILRTFSKAYGLAALRIGYGVASKQLTRLLDPIRPPFNTTTIAQKAAIASLADETYIQECRSKNSKGLEDIISFCKEQNLSYYPSQANFLLLDTGIPGGAMFESMLKKGVIVRSGEALGFPTCIRVTVGSEEENGIFIDALKKSIEELKAKAVK